MTTPSTPRPVPPEDPPHDAGDPESVARKRKKKITQDEEEAAVLERWLATEAGRRLFARILYETCGLHSPSARRDATGRHDAYATEFQEGCRSVGLILQREALQKAKTQYMLLVHENLK